MMVSNQFFANEAFPYFQNTRYRCLTNFDKFHHINTSADFQLKLLNLKRRTHAFLSQVPPCKQKVEYFKGLNEVGGGVVNSSVFGFR